MSAVATAMPTPAAPAPRKRRKRASAAGASDDCFTCSSRGYKCDRRRPYCLKCLDDGKDCSGYKTQLTWGVGVASRGKLRGLSLPVAGTKRAPTTNTTTASAFKRGHRASTSISSVATQTPVPALSISIPSPDSSRSAASVRREKQSISPPPLTSPFPSTWETPTLMPHSAPPYQRAFSFDTHAPITPMAFSLPPSGSAIYSPVDSTFPEGVSHRGHMSTQGGVSPAIPEEPAFTRPPPLSIPIPSPHIHQNYAPFTPFDSAFESLSPFPATYSQQDESYVRQESYPPPVSYAYAEQNEILSSNQDLKYEHDDVEEIHRSEACTETGQLSEAPLWNHTLAMSSSPMGYQINSQIFSSGSGIGRTPRLQFLINYYSEVIAPVIVAFDGPNNPYRNSILRLAADSDALQHAIAALAASNLRQRQQSGVLSTCKTAPARRSSMAHLTLAAESWRDELLTPMELAREETNLKNCAVQSLNRQLAHPIERKKDSTLAVLLMLALFHTCATGVAKFKTQCAGVRKLLNLRAAAHEPVSPETKFFTSMFAWFDSITASVNDREGQFLNRHLDLSALTDSPWSLENLAGCDGTLFRTIAKLSRLNLLSQGKPVEEIASIVARPSTTTTSIDHDPSHYDGNGWSAFPNLTPTTHTKQGPLEQFWREYIEVRHELHAWTLPAPSPASTLSPEQRADLLNISECFRYSALLYTERLANPTAPCSSPSIQRWVQRSLHFIALVKSDVYLLWPLFVTGAECVEAADREVVRGRCRDIQKDSGFVNNESCLGLLEGVWAGMDAREQGDGKGCWGFRFAEVMRRGGVDEGEYIVV